MSKIRDLMTTDPIVLDSSSSAQDAARQMREGDVGDVLVVEDGTLRGIVTDRDIVVRAVAEGTEPSAVTLGEICSGELVTLTPDDEVSEAVEIMRDRAIRRIPVVEGEQPVGILSIGDLAVMRDEASALADISASPGNR